MHGTKCQLIFYLGPWGTLGAALSTSILHPWIGGQESKCREVVLWTTSFGLSVCLKAEYKQRQIASGEKLQEQKTILGLVLEINSQGASIGDKVWQAKAQGVPAQLMMAWKRNRWRRSKEKRQRSSFNLSPIQSWRGAEELLGTNHAIEWPTFFHVFSHWRREGED